MAKLASISVILTISCLLLPTLSEKSDCLGHVCLKKEKLARLHFYVQDLGVNHPNTTTYDVAKASITATSPTKFGTVRVVDDLVTAEADANSRLLGRIQGMVSKSDLSKLSITMNLNIYFTAGKFAGSTLSIIGRNEIGSDQRELVVAGGTGAFRFARGYAIQTTESFGFEVAVLEYYVYTTYNAQLFIDLDDVEIIEM